VRRYLRELTDHLADLTERQRAAGYDEENAAIRARALLGDDAELAVAMEEQPGFRSIAARFPWAVFGVMPPLALILSFLLWVTAMVLIGFAGGAIPAHHKISPPVPGWYAATASGLIFVGNYLVTPLLGLLLAWMAQRQRMKSLWPLLAMGLILLLNMHGMFEADSKRINIGLGTILTYHISRGEPFKPEHLVNWPTFFGQAALLCLPIAWLLWSRRKTAAQT
jgi:hypothetical protein